MIAIVILYSYPIVLDRLYSYLLGTFNGLPVKLRRPHHHPSTLLSAPSSPYVLVLC